MLISFLVFFIILGILILIHEFGHFLMAKSIGVRVEKFSLGFGPKLFSFRRKDTEYLISLIPLGGYVKLAGDNWDEYKGKPDEYLSQKPGRRAAIIFFGPLFNYLLSFFCFCLVFFIGYPMLSSGVGELMDGYPAQEAGLLSGDKIIKVDGKDIQYWDELQAIIHNKKEAEKVDLVVKRADKELKLSISPRTEKVKNLFGQEQTVSLIGIRPTEEFRKVKYGFFESIKLGTEKVLYITAVTYKAIFRIISGGLSFRESVTGPLGIFYITDKVVRLGFSSLVIMMAILGVSLAIFNLLPLPILDGGHLLFLGIEKLRGKPLDKKTDELINRLGLSLIISLVVFITANDLVKFGWIDKLVGFFTKIKN